MAIFANESSGYVQQDIAARLDYAEDWTAFMALAPGDSIVTSNWACAPAGLIFEDPAISGALTSVFVRGGVAGVIYRVQNSITTQDGRADVRNFHLSIVDGALALPTPMVTALFDRFDSVREFKGSSLAFLDKSFPVDQLTDDEIWQSLVSAESDASHLLRTFFRPTKMIPDHADQAEKDALDAAGTAYALEAGYDFDPTMWQSEAWGFMVLRESPVISIESVKLTYPAPVNTVLNVPPQWLVLDNKYGHLRFVPAGTMMGFGPMTTFIMNTISSGRRIPEALQLRYFAGLENAKRDFPELVTLVKRMAILRLLKNAFLPQSASISSDGLSQSTSIDQSKWQDGIDNDLEALRQRLKGIRFGVL